MYKMQYDIQESESKKKSMRRFVLNRKEDVSGVSGAGVVVEGVEFTDGTVAMRWLNDRPSTVFWDNMKNALSVHGHDGKTVVEWID